MHGAKQSPTVRDQGLLIPWCHQVTKSKQNKHGSNQGSFFCRAQPEFQGGNQMEWKASIPKVQKPDSYVRSAWVFTIVLVACGGYPVLPAAAGAACLEPNQQPNGPDNLTFVISDAGQQLVHASNEFQIENNTLHSITFWGGFVDRALLPCTPDLDFSLRLQRNEDDEVGELADLVTLDEITVTPTGNNIPFPKGAGSTPEFRIDAAFFPADDAAWTAVLHDGSKSSCFFVWATAPEGLTGDTRSASSVDTRNWLDVPVDLALCIEATSTTPVPATSCWGMLCASLLVIVCSSLILRNTSPTA